MGVRGRWAWPWVVVVAAAAVVGARTPSRGVNEIEAFVKRLEYEVRQGSGGGAVYQVEGGAQVDLNLLPDDVIVRQVEDGLDEEFDLVDEANGDKDEGKRKNTTDRAAEDRQRSLMYQGVYVPDGRFNAFVDGVMVNMVVEMKRRQMDPLYFRIYSRGIVEHVPIITGGSSSTTTTTSSTTASPPSSSSFLPPSTSSTRNGRQRGNPIGGGVIRGLTNIKRFGNAEVQIAGNTTLVRSHYVLGPVNLELLFTTERGVRAVNCTLDALAAHALTQVNGSAPTSNSSSSTSSFISSTFSNSSSTLIDFIIDRPADYEVHLEGAKSERYRRLSLAAIQRLFKPTGRLERRLARAYGRARRARIPDVTKRSGRGGGRGGRKNGNRRNGNGKRGNSTEATTTPELP
ncbi:uncharacterized protein LOC126981915 isoform X1 [Eriocheir sinensis]|uniref:uncharacterized protein LOC126981915 isoform X1 n=1 Tax=Eriocheir sinensis TaxID=95602 RepID=UPI0021C96703|nr:uncharacterized protein LOC126981915 isoform X1 [Eriocheir sinensis]XP_050689538.1 uncharacterized protein LOC126981915 isoform X1 [Eriocheir sinensis]